MADEQVVSRFLAAAKVALRDEPHKYAALVDILNRFQLMGPQAVANAVGQLLAGRPVLIHQFNVAFLPEPHRIPVSEMDMTRAFLHKVKDRFRQAQHLYDSFLRLVKMYGRGPQAPFAQVTAEILALFRDHPDLQLEFQVLLTTPTQTRPQPANAPLP